MSVHSVATGSKGPRCWCSGGAALVFLLAAAVALGAAAAQPAGSPPWRDTADYTIDAAQNWDETARALEQKYPEPTVELNWQHGGYLKQWPGQGGFDPRAVKWHAFAEKDINAQSHFVKLSVGRTAGRFAVLRCRFGVERPEGLRLFLSTNTFAVVYLNGSPVYCGFFEGRARLDEKSIDVEVRRGPNEVVLVVEVYGGAAHVFFRVGRTDTHLRRVGILAALQKMFPAEGERVAVAQGQIAAHFENELKDPAQAVIEYRRLYSMSTDNPSRQRAALEGIARLYKTTGGFEEESAAWREVSAFSRGHLPERLAGDLLSLAVAAGRVGELDTAFEAAGAAFESGRDAVSFEAFFNTLAAYSLGERAEALIAGVERGPTDEKLREAAEKARGRLETLRGDPVFLDLNYSAASALENAKRLAAAGAYEGAAGALLEGLDANGEFLIPADRAGAGFSRAAAALLARDSDLGEAFRRRAADKPLQRASPADVLVCRPGTESARRALIEMAGRAAAAGRYHLSSLAALRCLRDFPGDGEAAALAVSSLAAAGRRPEAQRVFDLLAPAVMEHRLPGGQTVSDYGAGLLEAHILPDAASPMPRPDMTSLEVIWRAPLEVSGLHCLAGEAVRRSGPPVPKARGVVYRGRLYTFDGRRLWARDAGTGAPVFERRLDLFAGMRAAGAAARASLAVFVPPATLATGAGAVYLTVNAFDSIADRNVTLVVAADAESGRTLWVTREEMLPGEFEFTSPPSWAHDRVYVLARRGGGQMPGSYLVALDALDGAVDFSTRLASGYGVLSSPAYWLLERPVPASSAPAPAIMADTVYAAANSGVAAAVDCLTGGVEWAETYPRAVIAGPEVALVKLLAGRPSREPAACEGAAVFAPADSGEAYIMRPGRPLMPVEVPGVLEVIGTYGETAVCVGDSVRGIDLSTGEVLWRCARSVEGLMPGGAVREGLAYVPTAEGVLVVSADDGAVVAEPSWPDGVARGHLILEDDLLIAFGGSDVAGFRFGDGAVAAGGKKAAPAPTAYVSGAAAGGFGRIWAAPILSDGFLLSHEEPCAPVFFGEGDRTKVLFPGCRPVCWDITAAPRLAWRTYLGFRPIGALHLPRRVVVYNDWALAGLDATTGEILWVHQTPQGEPVESAGSAPIGDVVAAAGRIAYLRRGRLGILDAESGRELYGQSFRYENFVDLAAGPDFFVILASTRGTGTRCIIIDANEVSLRALSLIDSDYLPGAGMAVGAGRICVYAGGKPLAVCLDAGSGAQVWSTARIPKLAQILETRRESGDFIFTGVEKGVELAAVVLDAAGGSQKALYKGRAFGFDGAAIWVLDAAGQLCKYPVGQAGPALKSKVAFDAPWQAPLDWHFSAGRVYMLLGDPSGKASKGLWLARFDAAAGAKEGQWRLPIAISPGRAPVFFDAGGGRTALGDDWGVICARPEALCAEVTLPAYSGDGVGRGVVGSGGAATAEAVARGIPGVVVDGDLAEWAGARWVDVNAPSGGVRARVAFAFDRAALMVGIRTLGEAGAAAPADRRGLSARLTVGAFGEDSAAGPAVTFDALLQGGRQLVTVGGGRFAALSRPNRLGGADYEIAVPWRTLKMERTAPADMPPLALGVGCIGGGVDEWTWPSGVPFAPRYLGRVVLEGSKKAASEQDKG